MNLCDRWSKDIKLKSSGCSSKTSFCIYYRRFIHQHGLFLRNVRTRFRLGTYASTQANSSVIQCTDKTYLRYCLEVIETHNATLYGSFLKPILIRRQSICTNSVAVLANSPATKIKPVLGQPDSRPPLYVDPLVLSIFTSRAVLCKVEISFLYKNLSIH